MTNLFAQCVNPVVTVVVSLSLHSLVVLLLQGLELCFQVDHFGHRHLVLALQDLKPVNVRVMMTVSWWQHGAAIRLLALLRIIKLFVSIEAFHGIDALCEAVDPLVLLRQGTLSVLQLGLGLLQVHEQGGLLTVHLQVRKHNEESTEERNEMLTEMLTETTRQSAGRVQQQLEVAMVMLCFCTTFLPICMLIVSTITPG